jgi:hypothetical protein
MTDREGRAAEIVIAFFSMVDVVRVTMVRVPGDMCHRKLNADVNWPEEDA